MRSLVLCFFLLSCLPVLAASPSAQDLQFFESKIRPLLADKCYACHSVNAEKLKGDLLLDHGQSLLEGGDTGPALVPGKPAESLLIEAVSYQNVDMQMPPKSRLTDAQIADLTQWVESGAPWPDEPLPSGKTAKEQFDWKARKVGHWCWQPITAHKPPAVGADWARTGADHFVFDALQKAGLTPATETDRRTWIRRVYFAIIGLPPTPEQVNAFLADKSDHAFESVVDELLASPHFGERWGRHWLDLARYAESCGHEFDYTLDHAHEYRDYVIRAFNQGVPYDQFITEQVAGDLMPNPRRHPEEGYNESVIGTGFWFLHEAVHAPTDVMQDESDRMDNQIDVFGKTFLGLTIACSRCHDHKFDAIPTKDYYALAGYLQSSRMDYAMLDPHGKIETARKQLVELGKKQGAARQAAVNHQIGDYLRAVQSVLDGKVQLPEKLESPEVAAAQVIFDDFESGTYTNWTITGDAFGDVPAASTNPVSKKVSGYAGKYFVRSFPGSDPELGTATSKAFTIEKPFINFLIGGGAHKKKTCINLLIDGEAVLSATGKNNDALRWASWDVKKYSGKKAQLEIVDDYSGGWGHISIDEITFSDTAAIEGRSIEDDAHEKMIAAVATAAGLDASRAHAFLKELKSNDVRSVNHPLHVWYKAAGNLDVIQGFTQQLEREAESKVNGDVLADFDDNTWDGCWTTGHAFLDLPEGGIADSGVLSRKLQGVLRTPTFTLNGKVNMRLRSDKGHVRMIVDGYQMQRRNGLLFGGTAINSLDTKGKWTWHSLGNSKYDGHKVYLEFIDDGDGYIAIDQIQLGNRPPEPLAEINRAVVLAAPKTVEELVAAYNQVDQLGWFVENSLLPAGDSDLKKEITAIEQMIPTPKKVLAIADGTGENDYVYIRGNPHTKGELAPRQLPVAIFGEQQPTLKPEDGSGRLQLANGLVDPANPFPSRVMVNRIWHYLFGRGIVPSVDDFGEMGQLPSHPELLDYLAHDFMHEKDWSVKAMIRSLVLSSTYRQSSRPLDAHPQAAQADPINVLLHRMPIRRLEAEPIRDAVLAISGRLDPKMYGPSVPVHLTRFQGGRGRPGAGPLDGHGRRSIYLAVRRNFMSSMMLTFDYPTPFNSIGKRSVSNVPAQALTMMNDPAIVNEAKRWADQLIAARSQTEERIQLAYEQAFARPPSDAQRAAMNQFVLSQSERYGKNVHHPELWADLCHVLFNMKEFIYIN